MKIGILSFHDGINHGGYWQAYATYEYLRSKGYDAEIINYKNLRHHFNELRYFFFNKNMSELVNNIRKFFKFKSSLKSLNLTTRTYSADKIPFYNIIVVGADIVWNFEWGFLGKDPIYFGHGLKCERLIAFSPSIGGARYDQVPDYVTSGLKKFDEISVRDVNTKNLVMQVLEREVQITLDPTFLIDKYPVHESTIKEAYLLVYAFSLDAASSALIREYAERNSLTVVAMGYSQSFADYNLINVSPEEWNGLIKNASFIVTGTFHGTIFCLLNKKQFITLNNSAIDNKVRSLLEPIFLGERLIEAAVNFANVADSKIDYSAVYERLGPRIKGTKDYLDACIAYDSGFES